MIGATMLLMWSYSTTPVTTIQFQSMKACMAAVPTFDRTYGDALAVLRCVDAKTGEVR